MGFQSVGIVAIVLLLAGCGGGTPSQEEKDRQAEEYAKSFGVDANVSTGADGTRSIVIDQSLGGQTAQAGSNLPLPAGFPDDVQMYPQLNIFAASRLPSAGFMVQGQTSDSMEQVAEFYVSRMNSSGWTQEAPAQQAPNMKMFAFQKDKRTTSISLIAGQGTTVQLTTIATP
jgi:hypothetical protein